MAGSRFSLRSKNSRGPRLHSRSTSPAAAQEEDRQHELGSAQQHRQQGEQRISWRPAKGEDDRAGGGQQADPRLEYEQQEGRLTLDRGWRVFHDSPLIIRCTHLSSSSPYAPLGMSGRQTWSIGVVMIANDRGGQLP